MPARHRFGTNDTCWIFLAVASAHETRFLDEIADGLRVLAKNGVPRSSIFIFTNIPNAASVVGASHPPTDLGFVLREQSFNHAIVVAGGHGTDFGLACRDIVIAPYPLVDAVSQIKNLKICVLGLCQCYAGVFRYVSGKTSAKLVAFGATNFYPSLSANMDDDDGARFANVFQFMFFRWLAEPRDLDGDGHQTLIDAYTFAGVEATLAVQSIWADQASHIRDLERQLRTATSDQAEALREEIGSAQELLSTMQEPWISNPELAAQIAFF